MHAAALALVASLVPLAAQAQESAPVNPNDGPRAVLELFTSQGCSSCPAADQLIKTLNEEEGVLAVTMPVKLWDYLGWEDTLASELLTKRQIAYSVARGDRDLYTPQVVVNGTRDVVGSDEAAILEALPQDALPLSIDLELNGGVLSIDVGAGDDVGAREATLWLLVIDERVRVPIRAGENRGRRLTYHNVVRDMRPVGMWKGKAMSFDLPLSDLEKGATAGCVVIAQVENFKGPGRIVGAASLSRLFPARTVKAEPR